MAATAAPVEVGGSRKRKPRAARGGSSGTGTRTPPDMDPYWKLHPLKRLDFCLRHMNGKGESTRRLTRMDKF